MSQDPEAVNANTPWRKSDSFQDRPFRVKLRGAILTLIRLPNQRDLHGRLHMLSTSGGLMNVEKPLDEKVKVELIFRMGEITIREKAEIMFPMWATQGWLQPFRFIELPEVRRCELEKTLLAFVQGLQQQPASANQAATS